MNRSSRPDALRDEHEWHEQRADCARRAPCDFLIDNDDLAPARPTVWLVLAYLCLGAAIAMMLTACGGGIDDEEFMGPPYYGSEIVAPPRPCPISIQCLPDPTRG